jgi:hypothetical protein
MIMHKKIFFNHIHPIIYRLVDMGGDAIINYRSYRAAPGGPGAGYLVAQGRVVRWK